jgi:HK97 family phage prohead protease
MGNKLEYRFTKELRAEPDGKAITGYAAMFDSFSEDLGGFREVIKKGAFSSVLKGNPDVRCLINHNSDPVLGRTTSGTLTLSEDDRGLAFRCELPNTQAARDLHESVQRGDMDQMSFGFSVDEGQNWVSDGQSTIRELTSISKLFDVSVVTYPAYQSTTAFARAQECFAEYRDKQEQRETLTDAAKAQAEAKIAEAQAAIAAANAKDADQARKVKSSGQKLRF